MFLPSAEIPLIFPISGCYQMCSTKNSLIPSHSLVLPSNYDVSTLKYQNEPP